MNNNTINLRVCGSDNSEISTADLVKVATPSKTDSYQPIPHADLVSIFRDQMKAASLTIKQELHTTARFGQRYFGLFEIDMGKAGSELSEPQMRRLMALLFIRFDVGLFCSVSKQKV